MNNVLILSHDFPPFADGGTVRIHAFVKYLPRSEWRPIVLTVDDSYYPRFLRDESLLQHYRPEVVIQRSGSLEPKGEAVNRLRESAYGVRQNSPVFERRVKPFLSRVYRSFVIPDERILWLPHALRAGLALHRQYPIDLIFATTPAHSAGVIAALLSRLLHKPLVIDVRDDWVGNPHFYNGSSWYSRTVSQRLESWVVRRARRVVAVTEESAALFRRKYPHQPGEKFIVIPNGFDGEDIAQAQDAASPPAAANAPRVVYIGGLPAKRSPLPLFQALQAMAAERPAGELPGSGLPGNELPCFDFYGSARQDYAQAAHEMGLDSLVRFHGYVPRLESLRQAVQGDAGLLIIPEEEGSSTAIPGKVYEYLGAGKFVLALCPPGSAVDRLVRSLGIGISVAPNDPAAIQAAIRQLLHCHQENGLRYQLPGPVYARYERSAQTRQLAQVFHEVVS